METLGVNGRRIAAGGGNVDARDFDRINPFVRMMRVKQDLSGTGKWQDVDHVYTMITAGHADFIVEGTRYSLGRGDVIVLPPFQTHVIVPTGGEMLQQKIFHFDFFEDPERCSLRHEDVLDRDGPKVVPQRERLMGDRAFAAHPEPKAFARLEETYQRMLEEFQSLCEGGGCSALLRAYCTEMLVETFRGAQEHVPEDLRDSDKSKAWLHIENALKYIEAHFTDEDLSNERISEAIGVSPNYLTKRFRACFDMPLHRYVVRMRIERAQRMLHTGSCNITEAAAATGFSSIHVFSKTFKSVLGMTPSAYLENVAQELSVLRRSSDAQLLERRRRAMPQAPTPAERPDRCSAKGAPDDRSGSS